MLKSKLIVWTLSYLLNSCIQWWAGTSTYLIYLPILQVLFYQLQTRETFSADNT